MNYALKKAIFLFFLLSNWANQCCSQSISAQEQHKINIIQAWVQEQLKQGKIPTPEQMDSINKAVTSSAQPILMEGDARTKAIQQVDIANANSFPSGSSGGASLTITKQCLMGGSLTVPENKVWKVKRVLVNNGGYNIVCGSVQYDKELKSGEKLAAPFWSAEGNMLGQEQNVFIYTFEIEER